MFKDRVFANPSPAGHLARKVGKRADQVSRAFTLVLHSGRSCGEEVCGMDEYWRDPHSMESLRCFSRAMCALRKLRAPTAFEILENPTEYL